MNQVQANNHIHHERHERFVGKNISILTQFTCMFENMTIVNSAKRTFSFDFAKYIEIQKLHLLKYEFRPKQVITSRNFNFLTLFQPSPGYAHHSL